MTLQVCPVGTYILTVCRCWQCIFIVSQFIISTIMYVCVHLLYTYPCCLCVFACMSVSFYSFANFLCYICSITGQVIATVCNFVPNQCFHVYIMFTPQNTYWYTMIVCMYNLMLPDPFLLLIVKLELQYIGSFSR